MKIESDPEWQALQSEHSVEAIHERINAKNHDYIGDAILGAIDGGVTTFAVIAGAIGGGFDNRVVVILGFANLIADGFSMAVGNFLRARSQHERIQAARRREKAHIRTIPDGEREEVRQIFAQKGFKGQALERIVATLSQDEENWIQTMLREELGLPTEAPNAFVAASATFGAFLLVGLLPLLPFLFPAFGLWQAFWVSAAVTACAFLAAGLVKGLALKLPVLRSGIQTLLTGGGAALLAYWISSWLRQRYGAG
ncbi:MAG: VIT1/CCC1 transporter family protein [Chloroflexota bacterium]